jgi:biotin carboxyl carrier protein
MGSLIYGKGNFQHTAGRAPGVFPAEAVGGCRKEMKKMQRKKWIVSIAAIFLLIFAQQASAAGALADQTSVLSGKVSAQGLAAPGSGVKEGEALLSVDSIAGPAVAARATVGGVVAEVLVRPGDLIKSGQVIARIKPPA